MTRLHVPGFSMAVVKDFKIHWVKAYGVADAQTKRPLDIDTRFQSTSIVGLAIGQRGEGWYFTHSGSNLGYRAWMIGHVRKGYGLIMMTNSDNGMALLNQVGDRVERAYHWDSLVTQ
jgi:hypothetical protein